MLIKILSFVSCSTRTFNTHVTKDKTDSSSDVTLTLKRKPSSVSATNFEDSPIVGNLKPNKQEKKKQRFVSEEFTDGEENEQNMESCTPAVTTLDVLSKKLDSLATKDVSTSLEQRYHFPFQNVLNIKSLVYVSVL